MGVAAVLILSGMVIFQAAPSPSPVVSPTSLSLSLQHDDQQHIPDEGVPLLGSAAKQSTKT
jgi:outer membrane receptor for monomeric catechols